jgi:hypothetical protein
MYSVFSGKLTTCVKAARDLLARVQGASRDGLPEDVVPVPSAERGKE